MRRTLMMRMMVGLMGSEALISISSRVIPITDSRTMARSSWFHLRTQKHHHGTEQTSWRSSGSAAVCYFRRCSPVFKEASEAERDELQHGLHHKRGAEEVVAVFQRRLQRLRETREKKLSTDLYSRFTVINRWISVRFDYSRRSSESHSWNTRNQSQSHSDAHFCIQESVCTVFSKR